MKPDQHRPKPLTDNSMIETGRAAACTSTLRQQYARWKSGDKETASHGGLIAECRALTGGDGALLVADVETSDGESVTLKFQDRRVLVDAPCVDELISAGHKALEARPRLRLRSESSSYPRLATRR